MTDAKTEAQALQEREVNWTLNQLEKLLGAMRARQAAHASTTAEDQADLVAALHLGAALGTLRAFAALMPAHHAIIEDVASSVARHRIKRVTERAIETPDGKALIVPGRGSSA
ncbi:MAG TPA: hypothetical protein VD948_02925 [Rhodothermales bacterium]|nr:hypothetical protein [Rhodothermales bacterium]